MKHAIYLIIIAAMLISGCTPQQNDIIEQIIDAADNSDDIAISPGHDCDRFQELYDKYRVDSRYHYKAINLLNACCNQTNPSGIEPNKDITFPLPPEGYTYLLVTDWSAAQWLCTVKDPDYNPNTITIASWNIQTFGKAKAGKTEIMDVIAQTIAKFDIVAIQEIRDSSGTAIGELEQAVDALGTDYDYTLGQRLGRTQSKEQYAFMFRTDRIRSLGSYTLDDPLDKFHREPFIGWFTTIPESNTSFSFVLINVHTDPDEATAEIKALPIAVHEAQTRFNSEDDFIVLGDLNADCNYHNELDKTAFPETEFIWAITDSLDTNLAASSCTYDRIVITKETTSSEWGGSGVYLFDTAFNLTHDQAKAVSDHYPVYAVFKTNNYQSMS